MPPPPSPALPEEAVEDTQPAILEEILEQIFLRLPPHEPACLVRASLASKHWLALLTGTAFRGRYCERHGAPPMLGFLKSEPWDSMDLHDEGNPLPVPAPPFVSTTAFRARVPDGGWGRRDYTAWDFRHGRVLLGEINESREDARKLAVWDPMTGRRRELEEPQVVYGDGLYAAAVLCAVSGCDHLACHQGRFRVVHFSLHRVGGIGNEFAAQACVSSPETTWDCSKALCSDSRRVEWSDPCPAVSVGDYGHIEPRRPVLVNDALHFMLGHDDSDAVEYVQILKYDLSSNRLSVLDAPNGGANMACASILMAMEDGSLGFVHLKKYTLFIWSRRMGSDGVAAWTQRRVVDLRNLLPVENPTKEIKLLGSVEGSDIIFVTADLGIYKIDLKSLQQEKISDEEDFVSLIPYMGFYNPQEKGATCDAAH